jgi:hypothetical protein
MLPGLTWLRLLEAACASKCGRNSDANKILKEVERTRETEYVDAYYVALLYDALECATRR